MKKLFISIGFLLSLVTAFGQPITPRGSTSNTVADQRLQATLNFYAPRYADTTAANTSIGIDSCGAVIFTYDVMSFWGRACSPKRWVQLGGTVTTTNSPSITFSGNGATNNPLIASIVLSTAAGNALQLNPDGLFSPLFIQDGLKLGGNISNVGGIYTYDVQTALYVINSQAHTAPTTQVTLSNADGTFSRIDRIVATTSNTIVVIEGTPSANPQEPSYDPTTQLPLGIVLVTAGSTGPTVTNEQIYINNTEWTTSSSTVRINPASAVNPFSAPLDVQFTAAQNGDFITFTDPSPPTTLTNFKILTLKIISDAAWASSSRLILQWRNGLTNVGLPVSIFDGALFSSTQTSTYQTFTAAITAFAPTGTVTNFVITVSTTGANTISAKIDDIVLQGGDGAIVPVQGTFHQQGGNRYASNFVVGSQDNFPVQVIANSANHTQFLQNGTMWMQGTNPGISLQLGTFAASDYFIQRIANVNTLNVAAAGTISNTISGTSVYNMSVANGHLWNSSGGTFRMQINSAGRLLIGTNADDASALVSMTSTTQGLLPPRMTTTQKNAIASPATGLLVYDNTLTQYYYYNGSAWLPFGNAYTANNGITLTALNFQWGGTLVQNTTITGDAFTQTHTFNSITSAGVTFSSTSSLFTASQGQLVGINFSGANASASLVTHALEVTNTRTGSGTVTNRAIFASASGGTINYGVYADNSTSSGSALYGRGSTGVTGEGTTGGGAAGEFFNDAGGEGIRISSSGGLPALVSNATTATNTSVEMIDFTLNSSGTEANGFGMRYEYNISTATSNADAMVETITWSNATHATRTSQYLMQLFNNAVQGTVLTIAGNGQLTLGAAYQGLGAGFLAVSNGGVVTWSAASGAMTNPMTTLGDIIYSTDGAGTPGRIGIGSAGQVLTVQGGIPTWVTPGVGGSVTSVAVSSSDLTVGGSPITTNGTITLTLATVNGNVGTFGSSTLIPVITVNAKGLITAVTTASAAAAAAGSLTGTTLAPNVVNSTLSSVGTMTAGTITTGFVIGDVTMNLAGTDATGDIYFRNASGILTRLPIGSAGQVLVVNPTATGLQYSAMAGGGSVTSVTLNQPASGGFTISNSGVPQTTVATFSFTLTGMLSALNGLATTGLLRRTGPSTITAGTVVSLTSEVGGTLPVANGGTNINSITSSRVIVTNATGYVQVLPTFGNGVTVTVGAGTLDIRGVFNPTPQTLTDAATIVWNVTNGGNAFVNLVGTGRTLQIQNAVAGYTYTIRIQQGSANRTISTWPTGTRWAGGTVPTLSTTAGAIDIVSLYYDGVSFYATIGLAFS